MTVWCWVRSTATGNRFDVPLDRLDVLVERGAVVEIPGRRRRARSARAPKSFVDLRSIHKPRPPGRLNRKGNPS